jgi:CheY-like chemotaxis protein
VLRSQLNAWNIENSVCSAQSAGLQLLRAAQAAGTPFDVAIVEQCAISEFLDRAGLGDTQLVALTSRSWLSRQGRPKGIQYLTSPISPSKLREALLSCQEHRRSEGFSPSRSGDADSSAAIFNKRFEGRVLVAEDNKVNQELARRLLERLGCKVDLAGNGREAIQLVCSVKYDLIFMDCLMPEVDGLEATREIRRRHAGTRCPIIALTANARKEDRQLCLQAGMDDYLSKPVRAEDLAQMLERYLNLSNSMVAG